MCLRLLSIHSLGVQCQAGFLLRSKSTLTEAKFVWIYGRERDAWRPSPVNLHTKSQWNLCCCHPFQLKVTWSNAGTILVLAYSQQKRAPWKTLITNHQRQPAIMSWNCQGARVGSGYGEVVSEGKGEENVNIKYCALIKETWKGLELSAACKAVPVEMPL